MGIIWGYWRTVSGHLLEFAECLSVETRYIVCAMEILSLCQIKGLRASGLERYEDDLSWENEQVLSGAYIAGLLRDGLREKCWAQLCAESFAMDFGYEFYLHIWSGLPLGRMIEAAEKCQLFVELWEPLR